MSRRLIMDTREVGSLDLYIIDSTSGIWEERWRPLQSSDPRFVDLVTKIDQETFNHALRGWTSPFVKSMGLAPDGALYKVPVQECRNQRTCIYWDKKLCTARSRLLPWCYEPKVSESEEAARLAGEIVHLWREGVRVVVVDSE